MRMNISNFPNISNNMLKSAIIPSVSKDVTAKSVGLAWRNIQSFRFPRNFSRILGYQLWRQTTPSSLFQNVKMKTPTTSKLILRWRKFYRTTQVIISQEILTLWWKTTVSAPRAAVFHSNRRPHMTGTTDCSTSKKRRRGLKNLEREMLNRQAWNGRSALSVGNFLKLFGIWRFTRRKLVISKKGKQGGESGRKLQFRYFLWLSMGVLYIFSPNILYSLFAKWNHN